MRGLRRRFRDRFTFLGIALALSACGGGGSSAGGSGGPIATPTPTPTPVTSACSLRKRQDWALAQVNEWYLFPETLTYVNPSGFSNLSDYVDALTAGARAQGKDRYFTYVTSIAEETAYYNSGSTAGFGIRFHIDDTSRRLWVSEAFEGAPALNAGIDRGAEILAIGTSGSNLRTVSSIIASEGDYGLYTALGSDDPGVTRVFDIQDALGRRTVSVAKANYDIQPVSTRYGVRILDDNGRKVGYINLRTFIYSAEPQLRAAFGQLKAQGVQDVIVDLRYNGGGLLSVAQTLGDLLGGARHSSDVFAQLRMRPEKFAENDTYYFETEANAIAPRRIAFIGTEGTASASELVMNAFRPYLGTDIALIGDNTYGKPVGQIALDNSACDDRLRLIAFSVVNSAGQGGYFNGLASVMEVSCKAEDDITLPLGDPREASVARALDYLDGRPCSAITAQSAFARTASVSLEPVAPAPDLHPLVPATPSEPQRDMPGLF
ncbi:MAG: peptidase S41 [Sphingobium sp.]|nr:peptidase S41 [Sphingobium sp.]